MNITEAAELFQRAKARRDLISKQIEEKELILEISKDDLETSSQARWILTEAAQLTQSRFKERVESLVTMAIRSVFDRPFIFRLEFERKRNKMEVAPIVVEMVNGEERVYEDPKDDMGGGIIDIISFAFRIVLWSLENPRSRNVIILDEPMKYMGKLIFLGGQVLREISHKLGFQLIIVTHDDELIEIADRSYEVSHDGNRSVCKLVKGEEVVDEVPLKKARIKRPS